MDRPWDVAWLAHIASICGQGGIAIDLRLAVPQEIEVRAVEDVYG